VTNPSRRRRAALAVLAGTAAAAVAVPALAAPVSVATISRGDVVRPVPGTPKALTRALAAHKVVVMAFLDRRAADDASVARSLARARAAMGDRGVRYFTFTLPGPARFAPLGRELGVTETPSVAVVRANRRLAGVWTGLVDAAVLRQAIADAGGARNR
jgi:hypothetical protein